jgi:hypothetical protein
MSGAGALGPANNKEAAITATPDNAMISNLFFLSSIPMAYPFVALTLLTSTAHKIFLCTRKNPIAYFIVSIHYDIGSKAKSPVALISNGRSSVP